MDKERFDSTESDSSGTQALQSEDPSANQQKEMMTTCGLMKVAKSQTIIGRVLQTFGLVLFPSEAKLNEFSKLDRQESKTLILTSATAKNLL